MRLANTLFVTLAVLAFGAFGATAAHADGVIGVVVTGEATMQAPLASQLEGWLKAHGHEVMASPLDPDGINALVDCFVIENQECAKGTFEKRSRSAALVYARIDVTAATDGTRDVTLTGYWFGKGHPVLAERRFCERCNEEMLRATANELMAALSGAGSPETGHLKCVSHPAAARVAIDGHSVGVTPLEYDLTTGNHEISITADGHQVEIRTIIVRRGEIIPLDVPLVVGTGRHNHDDHGDGHDDHQQSHAVPGVVLGVGAVALVTGGVMIAVGGAPSSSGRQQPTYTNFRTPGYGVAIGGAVAIGVGVWLWTRHHDEPSSAPTVAITHDGGFLGWAGRF